MNNNKQHTMKFITPVSMTGTKEQLKSLVPELEKMGYRPYGMMGSTQNTIVTNYAGIEGTYYIGCKPDEEFQPTQLEEFNTELFLALAAMTDEPKGIVGEWWNIGGRIYQQQDSGFSTCYGWRKATKEEIIAHFSKLPEKWCIQITAENIKEVGGYYDKQTFTDIYSGVVIGTYLTSHNQANGASIISAQTTGSNFILSKPTKEYPKITFEQFKKHVLKQTTMSKYKKGDVLIHTGGTNNTWTKDREYLVKGINEEGSIQITDDQGETAYRKDVCWRLKTDAKNILGYRIKPSCKEYEPAAMKLAGVTLFSKDVNFEIDSYSYNKIKEAGVLDLWFDVVYEPEKPSTTTYTLGSNNAKVVITKGKDTIRVAGHDISVSQLKTLYTKLTSKFFVLSGFDVNIASATTKIFRIGCVGENHCFSLSEIKMVINEYDNLNK